MRNTRDAVGNSASQSGPSADGPAAAIVKHDPAGPPGGSDRPGGYDASDVRNIFALSSTLERHHMVVLTANNGRDAIDLIERTDDLALVLMDIMMPEMDGYETMRQIRLRPRLSVLPIIALTAKAMKGDREKCLEAGASEYVAKPVNNQQLVALFRTWLSR